jgi:IrrE N-terminal-like domain
VAAVVRRGFQAEADRLAADVRRHDLGLGDHDRLDPRVLADEHDIPVHPITDLIAAGADPASIRQLAVTDPRSFSAGTVIRGTARLIIFNPVHSDGRQANSLAHELAHMFLEHEPGPAIGPGGCRVWDQEMEEEANLLAAMLLVSREAALVCARIGLPHAVGAARFGVSADVMQWRTNSSGAACQARAEARKRGRTIPQFTKAQVAALLAECDLAWLSELSATQWRALLRPCGRALASGSLDNLAKCLEPPLGTG